VEVAATKVEFDGGTMEVLRRLHWWFEVKK